MGGTCVKLVFICEVTFEGGSGTISAGAKGTTMEAGASTEQGVEMEVATI